MGFPNRDRPNGREKRDGPRSGSARRSRDREESPSSRRSRSRHRISPSKDEHESLDSNSSHLRNSSSREMQLDYKNRPRRDRDGRGCYNGSGSRSDGGDDLRREGRQDEDFGDDRDPRGSGSFDRERYRDLDQDRDRDRHRDGGPERDRYRDRWLEDKAYRGGSSHRDRERWERGRPRDWDREAPRGSRRPRSIDRDWEDPERWRGNDGYRYEGHLDGGDRYEQQHHHHRQSDERYHRRNTPSTTVILQGLAPDITMEDIRPVVLQCGLTPKGVRVIKRRDTGASRGFAFVEFYALEDAVRWMEITQGVLEFGERCRVTMEYSAPREEQRNVMSGTMDWCCGKCGINNFERRKTCYKCQTPRDGEDCGEGHDEVSQTPTKTLLLRGLDTLSTVESVMEAMKPYNSVGIMSVRIGQDSLTNTSRGICYIDMKTLADAQLLHDDVLQEPPVIDGRRVVVSYCKPPDSAALGADAPPGWRGQRPEKDTTTSYDLSQYTLDDVPRLAAYSASLYASTPAEIQSYTEYYKQYYHSQLSMVQPAATSAGPQLHVKNQCQSDDVNAGAAVAQAAIQQTIAAREVKRMVVGRVDKVSDEVCKMALMKSAHLATTTTPHVPDVSTYQYDPTSGHYYDPQTGLYYDPTSQYYYNATTQQYSYWDPAQQTFLPAPSTPATVPPAPAQANTSASAQSEDPAEVQKKEAAKKEKERDKEKPENKVKVAKRIAKDMERWAKTLNQKKENVNHVASISAANFFRKSSGAADAGFAVLQRKDPSADAGLLASETELPRLSVAEAQVQLVNMVAPPKLVAAYDDASDEELADLAEEEAQHTDWEKLACLLCKRQFDKRDTLLKHQQVSTLHQQNVEAWYRSRGLDPSEMRQKTETYRDRAKERRLKFGQPDTPQPNRLKEKYLKIMEDAAADAYEEPTKGGISSDNIGNRMLQKLGWKEGMGLGKSNQGRTSIIQPNQRAATAGLGSKGSTYGPLPGEAYKDSVKRAMFARYQELTEDETK